MVKKKKWTINDWNAQIDHTFPVTGKNGIHYEYVMPIHGLDSKYYEDAIDVRSRNKRTNRYQPIGDKSYFTFYQLKRLRKEKKDESYIDMIKEILRKFYEK